MPNEKQCSCNAKRKRLIAAIDEYIESELERRDTGSGYWGQRCATHELKIQSLRMQRAALETEVKELKARIEVLEAGVRA